MSAVFAIIVTSSCAAVFVDVIIVTSVITDTVVTSLIVTVVTSLEFGIPNSHVTGKTGTQEVRSSKWSEPLTFLIDILGFSQFSSVT